MGSCCTDIFHFKNKHYLCIVDYNSKFPVIKRLEGLSAENLINTVKIMLAKNVLIQAGT